MPWRSHNRDQHTVDQTLAIRRRKISNRFICSPSWQHYSITGLANGRSVSWNCINCGSFSTGKCKMQLDDDKTNIIACNWNLRRSNIHVQNCNVSIFNLVQQYMYEYICISTSTTFVDVRSKGPTINNCFEPIYSNIVWEFKCKVY